MSTTIAAARLAEKIQTLVDQRQKLADAIAQIDATLGGVQTALSGAAAPRKRGRPPKSASRAVASRAVASRAVAPTRRKRRKYAISAEESILSFVKLHENPATKELKKHYVGEGRGGTVDNVLSKLVRDGKLKRQPLEGQRGSRYVLS